MKIALPRKIAAKFKKVLRRAGRREIGGILMGEQLEPGIFRIIDFSVDEKSGSVVHFVRSVEDHQASLEKFFSKTDHDFSRFNYLGEWHSHPSFSVQPSNTDIVSMYSLVNNEQNINFAVLLILKLRFSFLLESSVTIFSHNQQTSSSLF